MNNYEELKKIMASMKEPETEVELLSYKYLFDLFEKAYEPEYNRIKRTMYAVNSVRGKPHIREEELPSIIRENMDKDQNHLDTFLKEHQEIKQVFYKTIGGVE